MSVEPEEKTELEELEEQLKKLETLSVREESDAARSCRHLITVVMCTFAPPKLAVVMNALLTFPEKHKVSTRELSKKMQLDAKQMRESLANLKSMGYVLETTGITEWAQNNRNNRYNNNRNNGKAAQYHVDYQYFIMMTKFRLHSILKRLNAQQKKEDDMGDGYVCSNQDCYVCYKIKKIMDLIYEQQTSLRGKISNESHFVCCECGQPLIDAQKYYDNQNAALTKTMRFNKQMKSLRQLLTATEKKVIVERATMGVEISKMEDKMDRIKNGAGHNMYKAATLAISNEGKKGGKWGMTGLAHLDRIGRRTNYSKKDFLCKIEQENDVDMKENEGGKENGMEDKIKKMKEDKQFQKDVKQYINMIKEYEIGRNNEIGEEDSAKENQGVGVYPLVELTVDHINVKLSDILNGNTNKYEAKMTTQEWNRYQEILDQLGLLEID